MAEYTQTVVVVGYVMATVVMWGIRILVKILYDIAFRDNRALRVLIYGALSGGVGLAKNIRSQKPLRYRLCGFISHDKRAKHMQLMGEPVYNVEDDLESIIHKKHIDAVLVSPLRVEEFRDNQKIQDMIIGAGCKIFMAQAVKEANVKDGQLMDDDDISDMQLKEVSVEDLLPRSEIKVNLKTVGEVLKGKRVLITGAAGSIGSEIVRQVAAFEVESLMLIDQAETPEHDIRLMMAKEFPGVKATTVVTTITDQYRMEQIFKEFRPDYVFHAAAYKHVPMMGIIPVRP
jgi:FlaA1/EpsC-like NDP-sugar epimerase